MELEHDLTDGTEQWLDQKCRHRSQGRTVRRVLRSFTDNCHLDLLSGSKGVEDILDISANVEYSVNKRQRWSLLEELPDIVQSLDADHHVQLIEEMEMPLSRGEWKVLRFVDNQGHSRVADGMRGMSLRTAAPWIYKADREKPTVDIHVQRSVPTSRIPGEKIAKWCKHERRRMQIRKRGHHRADHVQAELFESEDEDEVTELENPHQPEPLSQHRTVSFLALVQQRPSRPQKTRAHRTPSEASTRAERASSTHLSTGPSPTAPPKAPRYQRTLNAGCKPSPSECLIPPSTLTRDFLQTHYQARYTEGHSSPRRFAINIHSLLASAVKHQHHLSSYNLDKYTLSAFLLFEEQQLLSNGLMRTCVWPLMCLQRDSLSLSCIDVDTIYPLNVLIDVIVQHLAETTFHSLERLPPIVTSTETTSAAMKWDHLFAELSLPPTPTTPTATAPEGDDDDGRLSGQSDVGASTSADDQSVCSVCFDGQTEGTRLLSCDHWFCNDCWRTHIESSISSSTAAVQCPAPTCPQELNVAMLLRFLTLPQYRAFSNSRPPSDSKPCPSTNCTQLLRRGISPLTRAFVTCQCSAELCYDCLHPPHWPARCDEARLYHQQMQTIIEHARVPPDLDVPGKHCPKCERFIYKESGCKFMTCPCGLHFCWECLTPWATHPAGHFDACTAKAQRHKIIVFETTQLPAKYKWLQTAIEHRQLRHGKAWQQFKTNATRSLPRFRFDATAVGRLDVPAFLRQQCDQFVTLCRQLHFIVEYGMVRIDRNRFSSSGDRARFKSMVLFVAFVANRLQDLFVSDQPLPLARMQHLATRARSALRNLATIDR